MIITITTDAAWHSKHRIGAYAFWITCDQGRFMHSGVLKEKVRSADEAEMQCIVNAVYCIRKVVGNVKVTKVVINTDSMNSIHVFTCDTKSIDQYGLHWAKGLRQKLRGMLKKRGFSKEIFEFRHIKAHTDTKSRRSWVNDWCDKKAKESMWAFINNLP